MRKEEKGEKKDLVWKTNNSFGFQENRPRGELLL